MTRLFLSIYRYFASHKAVLHIILISTTLLFGFFATRVHFEENIAALLPKSQYNKECAIAFSDVKVKDKMMIQVFSDDPSVTVGRKCEAIDSFLTILGRLDRQGHIENCLYKFDTDDVMNVAYYLMGALPCHVNANFYKALDTLLTKDSVEDIVSTAGTVNLSEISTYALIDGHLFSPDSTVALAYLSPSFSSLDTGAGAKFEREMTKAIRMFRKSFPEFNVLYHGAVCEGTFNAGQIKKDLVKTVGLSLLLICVVICICFKSKRTLFQLLSPVAYGTLFSLACVYWIKGEMSFISIGIGALVLGVALSYCLHVLTHFKFVKDVEDTLKDQTKPVLLGCITTVGAFAGLLFTSSELLKDFGLFASLALIGTTFFALAFLPQFMGEKTKEKNEKAFNIVNRINTYPIDRNVWVVVIMCLVIAVSLFKAKDVGFDTDLSHIGYREPKVMLAEKLYNSKMLSGEYNIYLAANSDVLDSAIFATRKLVRCLDSLKKAGVISGYSSPSMFLIPEPEQESNIALWKAYWTPEKIDRAYELLKEADERYGLANTGLDIPSTFRFMAESDYDPQCLYYAGAVPDALMCNFVENNDDGWLIYTSVTLPFRTRYDICEKVTASNPDVVVLDPFFYTGDMVKIVNHDFNLVLWVSLLFVFLVLLLSFRNLTVSVIAFIPMLLSWYILQGIMAIFALEFNLINIMISSFIFGIGVDYSIFVMTGLISKAKYSSHRLLVCHKAAIFFSAFTLLVVTGSLLFAVHPAIYSIGISTIIGMTATILITYTLEPLMFRAAMKVPFLKERIVKIK